MQTREINDYLVSLFTGDTNQDGKPDWNAEEESTKQLSGHL